MAVKPGLLVHNAAEIATLAGGIRRGSAQNDVALLTNESGTPTEAAPGRRGVRRPDRRRRASRRGRGGARRDGHRVERDGATGRRGGARSRRDSSTRTRTCCLPGTRHAEVEMRHRGHTYLDILAAGGGILQTVRMTRAASDDELLEHGRKWLREMVRHGVTTIEAKSGYGLDTPERAPPAGLGRTAQRGRPSRGGSHVPGRSRRRAGVS